MTCIYDTVEQVGVHIREAVLEAHADSEDRNSKAFNIFLKLILKNFLEIFHSQFLNYRQVFQAYFFPLNLLQKMSTI